MIQKLNNYLLTNYPRVWNMRLVPIGMLLIAAHILFALIGYTLTDNSINYNDYAFDSFYYIVFAGSILTSILVFIFWIIQYSKNNGLKVYYPYTNTALYLEWIGILAICLLLIILPLTLTKGKDTKWRSAMSEEDALARQEIIQKAKILLPENISNYRLDSYGENSDENAILVGDAKVDRTMFDTKQFTYEEDAEMPDKPITYIGPSLLYYAEYWEEKEVLAVVKGWLKEENKVEIEKLMQDYLDLMEKHNQKTNLTVDKWMKKVYHPPLYPVGKETKIYNDADDVYNHQKDYYAETYTISSYYRKMNKYYDEDEKDDSNKVNLLLISMAIGLSVMVFSGRFTSGKSWIFAWLSLGVIYFALFLVVGMLALLSSSVETLMFMPLASLGLFGLVVYAITIKVVNGQRKGRSNIYVHIGIWFIPSLMLLVMQLYLYARSITNSYNYDADNIFWGFAIFNILFTLIAMYPAVMTLRKWKALPED